jgi:hypothetical protein
VLDKRPDIFQADKFQKERGRWIGLELFGENNGSLDLEKGMLAG